MNIDLLGQLAVPHLIVMGAITYLSASQDGKLSTVEIVALVWGWLIPVIGPITAGIFILFSRKRREKSDM